MPKEKILITAALPYTNGPQHIGGLKSTYIPADVFVRYQRLKGSDVAFICASDEYGTPAVFTAEEEGVTPKKLTDRYHKLALDTFKKMNIVFDYYSRTSNKSNHELTQYIFKKLFENGYIYKDIVKDYYCPKCRKSLPDRYVKGTCPSCGASDQYSDYCENCGATFKVGDLKDAYCTICRTKPELKDSEHYIFKLSTFKSQLHKFLNNVNIREEVKNYVLSWIKQGLRDWDIIRDIDWGVPVEDMPGKVFYVWFNAPIGYISATRDWAENIKMPGEWKKFWTDKETKIVHFIGKDIVYHHCLFWPAMLIGTKEFNLPDMISVRGFLNIEGKKLSKSKKYWILADDFVKNFPADYLRFYLSLITPAKTTDGDFSWKEFQDKINNELLGNLGNFIHRTLSFTHSKFNGTVPEPSEECFFDEKLEELVINIDKCMENVEIDKMLKKILEFSSFCNQYFQSKEPWKGNAETTIYQCVNAVRSLAILLAPIIPESAQKIWESLNMEGHVHKQKLSSAELLHIKPGHKINKPKPLFRKIEDIEIKREIEKLKKIG